MSESIHLRLNKTLGAETSARARAALAGQRIYIPTKKRLVKDHKLRRYLGSRVAEKLCESFSGEAIDFPARPEPTPAKNTTQQCIEMRKQGRELNELAMLCGISRRRVLQILASHKKNLPIMQQTINNNISINKLQPQK